MFFYKCISIKVTEQIFNLIIVFAANFKVLKNGIGYKKYNTNKTTTIFEPVILTTFTLLLK